MPKITCIMKFICDTQEKEEFIFRQIALSKYLQDIIDTLKKEPMAKIFLQKVNKRDAPNYYKIVKNPMDLGTVEKKLANYNNLKEFKDDLDLIWDNCIKYNTVKYFIECANDMRMIADSIIMKRNRVYPECPEPIVIEKPRRIIVKDMLKECVIKSFYGLGIKKMSKKIIQIIVDVIEYKICEEIIKQKEK